MCMWTWKMMYGCNPSRNEVMQWNKYQSDLKNLYLFAKNSVGKWFAVLFIQLSRSASVFVRKRPRNTWDLLSHYSNLNSKGVMDTWRKELHRALQNFLLHLAVLLATLIVLNFRAVGFTLYGKSLFFGFKNYLSLPRARSVNYEIMRVVMKLRELTMIYSRVVTWNTHETWAALWID